MIRLPPRSTRTDTLFPYTTLFRSQIAKYVGKQLRYMQNPRAEAIRSLLETFDAAWATQLDTLLDDNGGRVKESIGSLVGQRNTIAHGRNSDVSFGRLGPRVKDAAETIQCVGQLKKRCEERRVGKGGVRTRKI